MLMDLPCIFAHFLCESSSCSKKFQGLPIAVKKINFFVFEVAQPDLLTLWDLALVDGQWLGSSLFLIVAWSGAAVMDTKIRKPCAVLKS